MPLSQKSKDILNFFFRLAFSVALLVWLFSKIDTENTLEVLKSSDLGYIFWAGVVFLFCNVVILIRWYVFVRALDLDAPIGLVIKYFFIGLFGNLFLPSAIGGDIIKIYGLCKNSSEKPKVVASVLIDRLSGFAGLIVVAILAFLFGQKLINDMSILVSIGFLAVISVVGGIVLFNERVYSFCCIIFNKIPKIKNALMQIHYDLALLKGRVSYGIGGVALSCFSQILMASIFFLIARGLHQEIHFVYFLIFVPLICVASTMPSIGGLGVREAGTAFLFAKVGVESGVAVSISLINFMFMIMVGLIGGVIYVSSLSSGRIQHYSQDPEVS